MNDVCMLTASSTPNQIRSMPIFSATGPNSGTMMKASSKKSRKKASTKVSTLTTIRKPHWPPGTEVSRCSTHRSPLTARKVRPNTVEPIRMNTTKHDSLVVVSMACLSRFSDRRLRTSAIAIAPTAPIAPPSVGVATPMKMVPSTRKIRNSGGIITKVTRSASADSHPSRSSLLASAMTKADTPQISMVSTMRSSTGAVPCSR